MAEIILPARDYDLAATLDSGQVFRWRPQRNHWTGIIGNRWVRLTPVPTGIHAHTSGPVENWQWLRHFLQSDIELAAILETFPADIPMKRAVTACPDRYRCSMIRRYPTLVIAALFDTGIGRYRSTRTDPVATRAGLSEVGVFADADGAQLSSPDALPAVHAWFAPGTAEDGRSFGLGVGITSPYSRGRITLA